MNKYLTEDYYRVENLDTDKLRKMQEKVNSDKLYYPTFHIAPKFGLLNDPNGLAYFNGEYHIFYQYCPNGPIHGMKSWYHLTTIDFINYTDHGIKLSAQNHYDNYGIYSGGAYVKGEYLYLLYTGNARNVNKDYQREPYQCLAKMNKDYEIVERKVIIEPDFRFHSEHFRDPIKYENKLIIGAQDVKENAQIAIYDCKTNKMTYLENDLCTKGAYMYECPNVVNINNQELLMYSPQGLEVSNQQMRNIYDVYYSVDKLGSISANKWNSKDANRVDYGFDFYAPQIFQDRNRTIMYAWLGQAGTEYPFEQEYQWSQMLTMPRNLKLINGLLYQLPIEEVRNSVDEKILFTKEIKPNSRAFKLEISANEEFDLKIGNDEYFVSLNCMENKLVLNRSKCQFEVATEYGAIREIKGDFKAVNIELYVDNSALEIFINDGRYTMTSRFFIEEINKITCSKEVKGAYSNMQAISYREKK